MQAERITAPAISVAVHVGILALLALRPTLPVFTASPIEAVVVDLVAPEPAMRAPMTVPKLPPAEPGERAGAQASLAPALSAPPRSAMAAPTEAVPSVAPQAQDARTTVKAERFYATDLLADPRNADTRAFIARLAPDERLVQLCNIELMEQMRRRDPGFAADNVIPYQWRSPTYTRTSLRADGAAVHAALRSGGVWRRVAFDCTVSDGFDAVLKLTFALGDAIPRERWEEQGLPDLWEGQGLSLFDESTQ